MMKFFNAKLLMFSFGIVCALNFLELYSEWNDEETCFMLQGMADQAYDYEEKAEYAKTDSEWEEYSSKADQVWQEYNDLLAQAGEERFKDCY